MIGKKRSLFGFIKKFLLQFVAVIALVFIVSTFILPYFIPVEKVVPMDKINEILGEQAGLKLELNGKTRISILPFIGVSAKNIAVQNIRNEFEKHTNVISAKKIDIKLSVFPLIMGNVVVKNILIEGADINIFKCNNKMNIFSPIEGRTTPEAQTNPNNINITDYIEDFGIANFAIKQSNFVYQECNTSKKYEIKGFDASISIPDFEKDISAKFSMALNGIEILADINSSNLKDILEKHTGTLKIKIGGGFGVLKVSSNYNFDNQFQTFFNKTNFDIKGENILIGKLAQMANIQNDSLASIPSANVAISGEIENAKISFKQLKLELEKMMTLDGTNIVISVPNRNQIQTISSNGEINILAKNIQSLASTMKLNLPIVKKYPSTFEGNVIFSFANNIFKLDDKTTIKIDDKTTVNISLIADVLTQVKSIAFSLSRKLINLDDYLSLQSEAKKKTNQDTPYVPILERTSPEPVTLPLTKNLILDGSISIGKLIAHNVEISNLSSKLRIRENSISNKISADVFQGSTNINIELNEKNQKLSGLNLDIICNNFEIGKILEIINTKQIITGRINSTLKLQASANNIRDLIKYGKGSLELKSQNFTLVGIDLDSLIKDVTHDYKQLLSANAITKYIAPTKKTTVDTLSLDATLAQGIVNNEKMLATKDNISLEGHGTINLNNENVNYTILPKNGNQTLPAIVIKRTLSDPVYTIDPTLYVKSQVQNALQEQVRTNPEIQEKLSQFNKAINKFRL